MLDFPPPPLYSLYPILTVLGPYNDPNWRVLGHKIQIFFLHIFRISIFIFIDTSSRIINAFSLLPLAICSLKGLVPPPTPQPFSLFSPPSRLFSQEDLLVELLFGTFFPFYIAPLKFSLASFLFQKISHFENI